MPNPNPYHARLARAAKRASALAPVLEATLEAVERARALLSHDDPVIVLRAVHGVSQASASAAKVYETTELASRVEALEQGSNHDEA
jgi:hypothetical protein